MGQPGGRDRSAGRRPALPGLRPLSPFVRNGGCTGTAERLRLAPRDVETGSQCGSQPAGGAEVALGGRLAGLSLPRQVRCWRCGRCWSRCWRFVVGLTDLLISGRMAEGVERVAVLDAMGLGGYVGWFFNILQGAVATGVMALVSRATGRARLERWPTAGSARGCGWAWRRDSAR